MGNQGKSMAPPTSSIHSTPKAVPQSVTFVKAGLPFLLFVAGSAYVLSSAIEGKNKEREVSQGAHQSKSERQYKMEKEKNEMMEKLQRDLKKDFDNTKRIERPEEVLERRRIEREKRNKWYNRWRRW